MPYDSGNIFPFESAQTSLNRSSIETERVLSGQFWGELRTFLVVAKTGSFSRAAELLNTSHPTVSRQTKRLQDLMGAQLIIATKQGVQLTDYGRKLAKSLAELDQKLFNLSSELRLEKQAAVGKVRLSLTEGLGCFFLAPAIAKMSAEYPSIQIAIESPVNLVDWRENQSDIGLTYVPSHSADVVSRAAGFLHLLPVASRGYVRQNGMPTPDNLSDHTFIHSELYAAKTGLWIDWQSAVARGRISHSSNNSIVYGLLVKGGLGIGLLGNYALATQDAVPLDLNIHVRVPLFLVAQKERLQSRPVHIVFEMLLELFGEGNIWFSRDLHVHDSHGLHSEGIRLLFGP